MQISKKPKENKYNNTTSNSTSSSQFSLLNSDKQNRYFQEIIKQGPLRQLNDNFNPISNKSISNIHSIFSSDERKKQVMNMIKKMREKQNITNKKNNEKLGTIQLDSNSNSNLDLFEKNTRILQRSSSVDKGNKKIFKDEKFINDKKIETQRNINDFIDKNNSIDYSKGGNFYQQYTNEIPIKLKYENKLSNIMSNNNNNFYNKNENNINKSSNYENKINKSNNYENKYSNNSNYYDNRNLNKPNNNEKKNSNN